MASGGAENAADSVAKHNTFDFIRLIAALAVVVEHSVYHLNASFLWHSEGDSLWFNGGVATFFILSGMMVYKSAERCIRERRPWWDFYQNRALRIVPAMYTYFVVLVVLLLVTGYLTWQLLLTTQFAAFAASNLLLIPVWTPPMLDDFGVGVVNGSLWTIPVEVSFYLIVPLIALLAVRTRAKTMLLVVLPVSAAAVVLYGLVGAGSADALVWKLYGVSFLPHLWWFAVGIFWAWAWPRVRQSGWFAAACVVLYFALAKISAPDGSAFVLNAVAAVPLSYAVIWFGYNGPKVLGSVRRRVGDLSFSVYIWHMIVINFLISYGARDWPIPGTILVSGVILVTCLIAYASWHLVERPALSRKRYTSATAQVSTRKPSRTR